MKQVTWLSPRFHPDIGGTELTTERIAKYIHGTEFNVVLLTNTPSTGGFKTFPFTIIRHPSWRQLAMHVWHSDLTIVSCLTIPWILPAILLRKPIVAFHHTWYQRGDGSQALRDRFKVLLSRCCINIVPSIQIARHLPTASFVLPGPYNDELFVPATNPPNSHRILFVGRLIPEKGMFLLLNALRLLKGRGYSPPLTIIGDGPERAPAEVYSRRHDLPVTFVGWVKEETTARMMREHSILVIPSLWEEPFGMVALEGLATGLRVIATRTGGLPAAVGAHGILVNPHADCLAEALANALSNPTTVEPAPTLSWHLSNHAVQTVAEQCGAILRACS